MKNTKEEKRRLRKNIKKKILNLPNEYCYQVDEIICNKVINLVEWKKAETVFCYVSTGNEVNTFPILKEALKSSKRLVVPKIISKGIMEACHIANLEELEPGKYGILEPNSNSSSIEPLEINLCIIPCLACTKEGERLGYGGGYYDRYLKRVSGVKIALCRSEMLMHNVPTGRYDVIMDRVITES